MRWPTHLLLVCTVATAVALAGCGSGGGTRQGPSGGAGVTTPRRPIAVAIIQSTKAPLTDGPAPSLVSVVRLDRSAVTTLAIPTSYAGGTSAVLSPDGRRILYQNDTGYPLLRVIDVESKADRQVLMFPPAIVPRTPKGASVYTTLLAYGWSTSGEVVALTALQHSSGHHGPPPGDSYLTDLAAWRGTPGKMSSETVSAEATTVLDGAIPRLLFADDKTAWFTGLFAERGQFPNEQRLLRYDFGSHKLQTVATLTNASQIGGVGDKGLFFLQPPFAPSPSAESLITYGVPVARTETHTRTTYGREYFRVLQGVDRHALTDFRVLGSIAVTSTGSPGNYVFQNEWGLPLQILPRNTPGLAPTGLPETGDWGLPVFDATYTHYLRSRAVTGGAELKKFDVASAEQTTIVAQPDPYEMPLGYVDGSGAALYTATDTTTRSVVRTPGLWLYEPGKGSRLLARLHGIPANRFAVYHPSLLGVVYEK